MSAFRRLFDITMKVRSEAAWYGRVVRHPRTPWLARLLMGAALIYAFSPVDLIPDFIPVLGQVDDFIVVPLLFYVGWKMVPERIKEEARTGFPQAR